MLVIQGEICLIGVKKGYDFDGKINEKMEVLGRSMAAWMGRSLVRKKWQLFDEGMSSKGSWFILKGTYFFPKKGASL